MQDCKERWKNLRACYSRHLKSLTDTPSGSAAKVKRPYYLAEALNFLQPFTKSRKSKGIYKFPEVPIVSPEATQVVQSESPNDSEDELHDSVPEHEESNSGGQQFSQVEHLGTPTVKRIAKSKSNPKKNDVSLADVNRSANDYFRLKASSTKEKKPENPDLDFFKSVLPDMNEMTSDQKRRFKMGILNLAGQILNENTSGSSSSSLHGYNNTQPPAATPQSENTDPFNSGFMRQYLQFPHEN